MPVVICRFLDTASDFSRITTDVLLCTGVIIIEICFVYGRMRSSNIVIMLSYMQFRIPRAVGSLYVGRHHSHPFHSWHLHNCQPRQADTDISCNPALGPN
jgi:hypothetical protein